MFVSYFAKKKKYIHTCTRTEYDIKLEFIASFSNGTKSCSCPFSTSSDGNVTDMHEPSPERGAMPDGADPSRYEPNIRLKIAQINRPHWAEGSLD